MTEWVNKMMAIKHKNHTLSAYVRWATGRESERGKEVGRRWGGGGWPRAPTPVVSLACSSLPTHPFPPHPPTSLLSSPQEAGKLTKMWSVCDWFKGKKNHTKVSAGGVGGNGGAGGAWQMGRAHNKKPCKYGSLCVPAISARLSHSGHSGHSDHGHHFHISSGFGVSRHARRRRRQSPPRRRRLTSPSTRRPRRSS